MLSTPSIIWICVARQADDPLDVILLRVARQPEHGDIAALGHATEDPAGEGTDARTETNSG